MDTNALSSNLLAVKEIYVNFSTGNIPGVLDALSDNVTWIDFGYPDIPYAGTRKGKEAVVGFFTEMSKTIAFTQFTPKEFFDQGDTVLVTGFFAAKSTQTGKTAESEWVMIWKFKAGKVNYYHAFVDSLAVANALK